MYSGKSACGKSSAPGNGMTGISSGKMLDESMAIPVLRYARLSIGKRPKVLRFSLRFKAAFCRSQPQWRNLLALEVQSLFGCHPAGFATGRSADLAVEANVTLITSVINAVFARSFS